MLWLSVISRRLSVERVVVSNTFITTNELLKTEAIKQKVASFLALQRLTKPLADGHIPYTENGRRLFRVKE